jgi:hypothetical protein
MVEPAPKISREELAILPPSFDFAKALSLVQSVHDLHRTADEAEAALLRWKTRTSMNLREAEQKLREAAGEMTGEQITGIVLPMLNDVLKAVRLAQESIRPLDDRHDVQTSLQTLNRAPAAATQVRKFLKRAEEIRQAQLVAYDDYFMRLYALQLDLDPEARGGPSFDNTDDLLAYLHS